MPGTGLQQRQKLYYKLSSHIAQISNAQLHSLLDGEETQSSRGENHTLTLGTSMVFVKRIPITDLEYAHMFSTRNVYNLPTYYNYPFNSAGMGVFRELISHIKTTNWVLDGTIANFPLMYHYRIIPYTGPRKEIKKEYLTRYLEYWGSDPNIERYIFDRSSANHELILFLEHFPFSNAEAWLLRNPGRIQSILDDMKATITFLRKNGIIHLDSHFHNILTDGKQAYLTDFGLVLDKSFDLSPAEEEFFKQNSYYDYGNLLLSLISPLFSLYDKLSDAEKRALSEEFGASSDLSFEDLLPILLNNLDRLAKSSVIKLGKSYVANLARYRDIVALLLDFYATMRANNNKDDRFNNTRLRRLLKETGFVPDLK